MLLPEKASSHWLNDILLHNLDQNNTRVHTGNIRVSILMLLVCCPYVFVCYSFVTRMYPGGVSVKISYGDIFVNNTVKALSSDIRLGSLSAISGSRGLVSRTAAGN